MSFKSKRKVNRRELLALLAGVPLSGLVGCDGRGLGFDGRLLSPDYSVMHQLRDGWRPPPTNQVPEKHRVVIVGGGMAGLSAAWQLRRNGIDDFVILESDSVVGGTARSGQWGNIRFPWAAHYVPVPMKENRRLVDLFREMGVIVGEDDTGAPIVSEADLCRDPQERVFAEDRWIYGLFPSDEPDSEGLEQLERFRSRMLEFSEARDDRGRRLFAIPISSGSDSELVRQLDRRSMSDWMDEQGFSSPALRWFVEYGCRDDYGLTLNQTSAWAGVFYFASRWRGGAKETQEVMTWPEGNGRIVDYLAQQFEGGVRKQHVVTSIRQASDGTLQTIAFHASKSRSVAFESADVIFAAPQFVAARVIESWGASDRDITAFQYGGWVVGNVYLSARPRETRVSMCWDNVIADDQSLGYVTATHQMGLDHGPTVLSWYRPLLDDDPRLARSELMRLTWDDWATVIVSDLQKAHPDIRPLIRGIDVMRWGHAMIQPRVGFMWGGQRENARESLGKIHFAASDLGGVALMEEAFDHGTRAADRVIAGSNRT